MNQYSNGKDSYYIFHDGFVYTSRIFPTWKQAYKAAKKFHKKAFIMSKSSLDMKKKRREMNSKHKLDKMKEMRDQYKIKKLVEKVFSSPINPFEDLFKIKG